MEGRDPITAFLELDFHVFALIILTLDLYNDKKKSPDSKTQQKRIIAKTFSEMLVTCLLLGRSETVEEIRLYQSNNSPNEIMINTAIRVIH